MRFPRLNLLREHLMSHTPRDEIKNILREYFAQRLENEFDQTDPVKIDEFVGPKVEELLSKFEESVLSREITASRAGVNSHAVLSCPYRTF